VTRGLRDAETVRAWCARAVHALEEGRARIDAVNVFPVADADTGTNVLLTLRGGAEAIDALPAGADGPAALAALARGVLLSARGSSGMILSRYLGALAAEAATGADLATVLVAAADGARDAVQDPQEGTVLTLAATVGEAARAAGAGDRGTADRPGSERTPGADDLTSLAAGLVAGHAALDRISAVHPVLRSAHVVDAGACALLVVLDALADVLAGRDGAPALDWLPAEAGGTVPGHEHGGAEPGSVEVMAVLPDVPAVAGLGALLADLGDAVAVVAGVDDAGRPVRHAHVHTGRAVEALDLLRAHGARAARVHDLAGARTGSVACVTRTGPVGALARAGAVVLVLGAVDPGALDGGAPGRGALGEGVLGSGVADGRALGSGAPDRLAPERGAAGAGATISPGSLPGPAQLAPMLARALHDAAGGSGPVPSVPDALPDAVRRMLLDGEGVLVVPGEIPGLLRALPLPDLPTALAPAGAGPDDVADQEDA
jgi:uncharacterized protein